MNFAIDNENKLVYANNIKLVLANYKQEGYMGSFLSGSIMGFREGLEAFLIIVIIIRFLDKTNKISLKKTVKYGVALGVGISLFVGGILYLVSNLIGKIEETAKLWESAASLLALCLVTTFIVWMIKNGSNMTGKVENDTARNLSRGGIILISALMIAREGVEIAIFTFAGDYNIMSIFAGVVAALILSVLIYYSLVKVNIKTIFNITMGYLILQAGFLLGYGIHEGLSALKDIGYISKDSFLLAKVFDLSKTVLNHKEGILGLPLYVILGWYSKPEWVQFISQYLYISSVFIYWYLSKKRN
jgi:high-affinity iron transporter